MLVRAFALLLLCAGLACPDARAQEAARPHTAGPGVRSSVPPLRVPAMGFARGLRVYLPPDYATGTRRYPVLYMFDGQNLFDDATSYAGEWGVDESMDRLAREEGFAAIVVGLDHGGELRMNELIPYWNVRFLPNMGAPFADDLVNVVKPFIDANFRTLPGREHTAVIGSSLGGLEADFVIHRYPQVFSRAGVFSPSYWVSEEPFARAASAPLPAGSRIYLFMGGREGEESVAVVERMARTLQEQAADGVDVTANVVAEAEHNEAAWRAEFPRAVRWLFALPQAAGAAAPAEP